MNKINAQIINAIRITTPTFIFWLSFTTVVCAFLILIGFLLDIKNMPMLALMLLPVILVLVEIVGNITYLRLSDTRYLMFDNEFINAMKMVAFAVIMVCVFAGSQAAIVISVLVVSVISIFFGVFYLHRFLCKIVDRLWRKSEN